MLRLQILTIILVSSETLAFLEPDITGQDNGHCIWYGECGMGFNQGKLNCPVTNSTKTPPKLTDPDGLRILKTYCPRLYQGDESTYTCCSGDQLRTLERSTPLSKQLLSRCPACFFNFLNSICQVTCSPEQGKFIWPDMSLYKPDPSSVGIPGIAVVVSDKYAQGLFDSCKDVQMPGLGDKALSIFCGRRAEYCSPLVWLNYMGNTGNGRAPFIIKYIASNTSWKAADGHILYPLNQPNKKCNETVTGSSAAIGTEKCKCEDCARETCPPAPKPTRKRFFDSVFGKDQYRTAELIIRRADSKVPVRHFYPPPSLDPIFFTSLFDKNFIKQVLVLQQNVAGIIAQNQGKSITLDKICASQNGNCVTESVLQYFQNNGTKIDKVAYDEYHIFVLGDYLDHFLSCTRGPGVTMDITRLKMSCVSVFGNTTLPYVVMQGYNETNYQNATSFVITYVLQNTPGLHADVIAWENAFVKYMKTYSNQNMTVSFSPSQEAFLDQDNSVDKDTGHCIWYGECGTGYNQGKLNCPVTNSTKTPPKLTDQDGLRILKTYCPSLYQGDESTYTCCSGDQLRTLERSISLPIQLLSRCPACFFNFLNSVCQVTCSPEQGKFIWPDMSLPKPDPRSVGIPGIVVVVSDKYAQGLFDSCKDVQMPSASDKAVSVFCGRRAEECSPLVLLNYMGNTGNGRAPFTIKYIASNTSWKAPDGQILYPLNQPNKKCNETVTGSSAAIGTEKCKCEDCARETCPPAPKPNADTRKRFLDSVFGKDQYRTAELIIGRADSKAPVRHMNPPPSIDSIYFTSLFDKDFIKQVLNLQENVAGIIAQNQGKGVITLDKICAKQNGNCVTESVLQYFQNNATKIDKVAYDEYHIFVLGDYLDHFLSCTRGPGVIMDVTALNMSCVSVFGNTTLPYIVMQGYNETNYQNATSFVITYVLQNTPGLEKDVMAWENAFVKYMKTYSNPNMTVSFTPSQEFVVPTRWKSYLNLNSLEQRKSR